MSTETDQADSHQKISEAASSTQTRSPIASTPPKMSAPAPKSTSSKDAGECMLSPDTWAENFSKRNNTGDFSTGLDNIKITV